MSRHILVLSATGTTGRQTVHALVARGARVRAASRDPQRVSWPEGVEAVRFDLEDATTWAPALAGVDAVYFALPPFRADEVELATALLQAIRAAGIERIVKLSAMGVEHMPDSAHRRIELLIEASGLAWVHLRPTFFMDNFVHFYGEPIRAQGVLPLPAGKGRTGFVAAEDIGAAAAEALLGDVSGEAWELTGPESLDHDQVASVLAAAAGRPVQFVDISPDEHIAGMRAHGMPPVGVALMSGLYAAVRAGQTDATVDTVQRVLGRPPVDLASWAVEHAGAWQ